MYYCIQFSIPWCITFFLSDSLQWPAVTRLHNNQSSVARPQMIVSLCTFYPHYYTLTNTLTGSLTSSLAGRHIKCSGQQTKSRSPCAFRSKYFRLKGSGVFAETQTCFCLYFKVSSLQNVLKYEDEDTKIMRFLSIVFVYIVTFSARIDCAVTAPIIHAFIFQHKKFGTLKAFNEEKKW